MLQLLYEKKPSPGLARISPKLASKITPPLSGAELQGGIFGFAMLFPHDGSHVLASHVSPTLILILSTASCRLAKA